MISYRIRTRQREQARHQSRDHPHLEAAQRSRDGTRAITAIASAFDSLRLRIQVVQMSKFTLARLIIPD